MSMSNHVDLTEDAEDEEIESGFPGCVDGCHDNVLDFSGMDKVILTVNELVISHNICVYSAEVTFTAESIELQRKGVLDFDSQNDETFLWLLDQINGFSSYSNIDAGYSVVELELCPLRFCKDCFDCNGNVSTGENVIFKVDGGKWPEQQQQITALCDHYKKIWRPLCEGEHLEMIINVFGSLERCPESYTRVENDGPIWKDIVYPKEDPDAVTVTITDFQLLNPMEFLSDTIIDFYIKHLQTTLSTEDNGRFYFYNSFFFRKLTEIECNLPSRFERRKIAFDGVKRWTSKTNIFDKDYLFVPVMQSEHWSLIIICHPNQLPADDQHSETSKACCILHLDSIEGFHTNIEEPIRNYLVDAWIQKFGSHNENVDPGCKRLSEIEFICSQVPQQTNLFDCGLFLLHYLELFIKQAEDIPHCLTSDWFDPAQASAKRASIRELIIQLLLKDQNKDVSMETCNAMMQYNNDYTGSENLLYSRDTDYNTILFPEENCAAIRLNRMEIIDPFVSRNTGVGLPLSSLQDEICSPSNELQFSNFQLESVTGATLYTGSSRITDNDVHPDLLPYSCMWPEVGGSVSQLMHVMNEMITSLDSKASKSHLYVGSTSNPNTYDGLASEYMHSSMVEQCNSQGPSSDSFTSSTPEYDQNSDEILDNTEDEAEFCIDNCRECPVVPISIQTEHGQENDMHLLDLVQFASHDEHTSLAIANNITENISLSTVKQENESIPFKAFDDAPIVEKMKFALNGYVINEETMNIGLNTVTQTRNECKEDSECIESLGQDEAIEGQNILVPVKQSGQFCEVSAHEHCEGSSSGIFQVPDNDDIRYISSDGEGYEKLNKICHELNLKKPLCRGRKQKQKGRLKHNLSENHIAGGSLRRSGKRIEGTLLNYARKRRQLQCTSG